MNDVRGLKLLGRWTPREICSVKATLSKIPRAWIEGNEYIRSISREPRLLNAPRGAPGHSKYSTGSRSIVVYDKGVYHAGSRRIDEDQFRRSVLHELAHALLRKYEWIDDWVAGTKPDGFIDEYAKTSPDEDFAETFSEFFINKGSVERSVPKKSAFIRRLLEHEGKTSMNMDSFSSELDKLAAFKIPSGIFRRAGGMPRGIKVLLGAGAGLGAYSSGKSKGTQQGRAAGSKGTAVIAQRAYKIGVMRGAVAMRQQIMSRLGSSKGS